MEILPPNAYPGRMNQDLEDIKFSLLWPTVVMQSSYVEHLQETKREIYRLITLPNDIKKSNYGGWQSDVRLQENPVFKPLCDHIGGLCARIFKVKDAKIHQMWACLNKKHDQNLIHSHTNNYNLSGVYYVSVPPDSGEIVFRDPRPGANQAPYRLFKDDGDSEYFMPSAGTIILFPSYLEHFVLPNRSDRDRISVSFDLTLEK
jgi:uncharacterized protein (TIGR02466 family)